MLSDDEPHMTLAIAWIRHIGRTEELVVAADSRLRSRGHWDGCPKILMLPRSDAVMCFAGNTMHAYPLMLQLRSAIAMYPKARNRAMDLTDLWGHLVRVLNAMRQHEYFQLDGADSIPDAAFLLGGYSWKLSRFMLWTIYYDTHARQFSARRASRWRASGSKYLHFVGDDTFFAKRDKARIELLRVLYKRIKQAGHEFSVIDAAKRRLIGLLREKGSLRSGGFDMEPLEILRDMLREGRHSSIGGPPQIAKVYKHMNTSPFGIRWNNRVTVLGRTLMPYEKPFCPVLDPDTLAVAEADADLPQADDESYI
jgi:hypothetical protein